MYTLGCKIGTNLACTNVQKNDRRFFFQLCYLLLIQLVSLRSRSRVFEKRTENKFVALRQIETVLVLVL